MDEFFREPILNSPYECPRRHWELDGTGQPTNRILDERRRVALITPIPAPWKRRGQRQLVFDKQAQELEADAQQYRRWWKARIARQQEIDASIAAKADYEYL